MAGAPINNKNPSKEFSDEVLKQMFDDFLIHLEQGRDLRSWAWVTKTDCCCWKTLLKYLAKDPIVFPPKLIAAAKAKGYRHWEAVVEGSAKGTDRKANVASLRMIMRNKFKWDSPDPVVEDEAAIDDKLKALVEIFQERKIDETSNSAEAKS
jgi:hypothetical protein